MNRAPRLLAAVALGVLAVAALLGGRPAPAAGTGAAGGPGPPGRPGRVVFLSHVNDPAQTPVFPGDPEFTLTTVFTVAQDGFYLQYVKEGEHTGTTTAPPATSMRASAAPTSWPPATSSARRWSSTSAARPPPTPTTRSPWPTSGRSRPATAASRPGRP